MFVQPLDTSCVHLHHLSPPDDDLTLLSLPTEPPPATAHPHIQPALVRHRTPSVLGMALIGCFLYSSSWPAPCCAPSGRSPPFLTLPVDSPSVSWLLPLLLFLALPLLQLQLPLPLLLLLLLLLLLQLPLLLLLLPLFLLLYLVHMDVDLALLIHVLDGVVGGVGPEQHGLGS